MSRRSWSCSCWRAAALLWSARFAPGASPAFSLLLLATVVSLVLSTALSPTPALSLYGSTWRRYGLVAQVAVLLFAWFVSQTPDRRTVVRGISLAGAVSALYGIAQYFGWDPILPAAAYHIGEGIWTIVRPPGTLGYVSYFATWLLVCGFLSLSLENSRGAMPRRRSAGRRCCSPARAPRSSGWPSDSWSGCTAAASASRGACWRFVALAVAGRRRRFYFSPVGWNLRSRTRWFVEDPWGGARPLLWRDSLRMATHRPLAGYGPETFTADVSALRIEGARPRLSRFRPRIAAQHLPRRARVARCPRAALPRRAVRRSGCALEDPWIAAALARRDRRPAVHGLHDSDRAALLRDARAVAPAKDPAPLVRLLAAVVASAPLALAFALSRLPLRRRRPLAGARQARHRSRRSRAPPTPTMPTTSAASSPAPRPTCGTPALSLR